MWNPRQDSRRKKGHIRWEGEGEGWRGERGEREKGRGEKGRGENTETVLQQTKSEA